MRPLLSKSTYMYGLQCHKRFYLHKFHKDFANPEDEQTQAIFQQGTDVGALAIGLFPGGVNAQDNEPWHSEITVKRTAALLGKHSIIYEAAFMYNDVICAVDILVKKGNSFYAFEVKSTNSVKPQHIEDAALQYYVLSNAGINLADFSIVHFNKEYVKMGELDIEQLFLSCSVLDDVLEKQDAIAKNIADFKKLLRLKTIPQIDMGPHCNKPYACNFSNYCLSQQAPEEEMTVILNQQVFLEIEAWKNFIAPVKYPLFFFDFETIMYGVPLFDFSRPYQQIPFQYSLHILLNPQAKPLHTSYLGDGQHDPRPDLIQQMIRDLGESGTIITWNMSFEKTIIQKLAQDFPEYEKELMSIHDRVFDLMTAFRPKQGIVTSEAFEGSYSIKKVLPIMVSELSYTELNIQEGGPASFMYGQMQTFDNETRAQLRKDLLDYCYLDTFAMFRIWQKVMEIAKG